MKISIVQGYFKQIENKVVKSERKAYFQLYLPQADNGNTQDMVTISRVKPNQINIKPVEDKNGLQGKGYFCQGTSRFNFHLIDSAKLADEAKTFGNLDNFAHESVKWTVESNVLNWSTPMKDKDRNIIPECNFCYSIDMPDLGKAIAELKTYDNDVDLRDYIDSKVDKTEKSNTKRPSKERLIG